MLLDSTRIWELEQCLQIVMNGKEKKTVKKAPHIPTLVFSVSHGRRECFLFHIFFISFTKQNPEILMLLITWSKADIVYQQASKISYLNVRISNGFKLYLKVLIACKSFWKEQR